MNKVEQPTEGGIGSVLLFISGGMAIWWGLSGLVFYGVWGFLDLFVGILLIVIGYLLLKMRYLIASASASVVIGLAVSLFFIDINLIGAGLLVEGIAPIIAGILGFVALHKSGLQQRTVSEMLEVIKLHESIKIDDLARKLATKEVNIELAVARLKKDGVPVSFNKETREIMYEKRE